MSSHEEEELFGTDAEVERLVSMFESCTLPRARWTHRAHLTVGLWYLVRHEEAVATDLIRRGIQRYNQACGIETTETSGYHETVTLFYARMIERFLRRTGKAASIAVLAEALFNSMGDKQLPLDYYSRERLMSGQARTGWVEPDLKPLD